MITDRKRVNGYSLIELLVATLLFAIIAGTVFSLLLSAQLRYREDSGVTAAFQQANVAIDQITRDVHSAGFPPPSSFAAVPAPDPGSIALPFSWSRGAGYPDTPCTVNVSCGAVPGDNDLILETETDPGSANGVQWIRYSLQGTTLMRGVASKVAFQDPIAATDGSLLPYLENVQNGALPIFSYKPQPPVQPSNIREVNILLIVRSTQPDPQTGQFRTITLTGQAARFNPNE